MADSRADMTVEVVGGTLDLGQPVVLDPGDVQLGAVEVKDADSDARAKVTASPASDTDAGLVVRLPRRGTLTDRSGTIAVGATAQQVMAANTSRRYLLFQNASDTDMWINFTAGDAVATQPSLLVSPGRVFVMEAMFVTTERVSVLCATTGKAYTAKEG